MLIDYEAGLQRKNLPFKGPLYRSPHWLGLSQDKARSQECHLSSHVSAGAQVLKTSAVSTGAVARILWDASVSGIISLIHDATGPASRIYMF